MALKARIHHELREVEKLIIFYTNKNSSERDRALCSADEDSVK